MKEDNLPSRKSWTCWKRTRRRMSTAVAHVAGLLCNLFTEEGQHLGHTVAIFESMVRCSAAEVQKDASVRFTKLVVPGRFAASADSGENDARRHLRPLLSDLQRDTSIVDQLAVARRYAQQHEWEVLDAHIYTDAAISGSSLDGQPASVP